MSGSGHPRLRVLAIDDEPLICRAIRRSLGAHDVVVVEEASEAFALLEQGRAFDVVLCDLSLRGIDGLEVLSRIETMAPDLRGHLVLMSGGLTPAAHQAVRTGRIRVLDKPFSTATLLETLASAARA